jgi:hypothetical protein
VYVHKVDEAETAESLVFRYSEDGSAYTPLKLTWSGDDTLNVSVATVSEVTQALAGLGGVKIIYSIGNEEFPRSTWQEEQKTVIEILVAGAVLCVMMVLSLAYLIKTA